MTSEVFFATPARTRCSSGSRSRMRRCCSRRRRSPLIAIGLWWNANTIAHNFIHRPFFRVARAQPALLCVPERCVLGVPQTLWRDAAPGAPCRRRPSHFGCAASTRSASRPWLVAALWRRSALVRRRGFFLSVYLPGWLIGLALCQLQGYFEHARRHDEPLRPPLQPAVLQRRLSRRASRTARRALDGAARVEPAGRAAQPLAAGAALARRVSASKGSNGSCCDRRGLQRFVIRRARAGVAPRARPCRATSSACSSSAADCFRGRALVLRRLLPSPDVTIVDIERRAPGDGEAVAAAWSDAATRRLRRRHRASDADLVVIPLCIRRRSASDLRSAARARSCSSTTGSGTRRRLAGARASSSRGCCSSGST